MVYYLEETKKIKIGTINFNEDLEEAAKLTKRKSLQISKIGSCDVFIYGLEGMYIPHVHIVSHSSAKGENKPFDCCVQLLSASYFVHPPHSSTFKNSTQCKQLNKWFKEESLIDGITNWQNALIEWNKNNDPTFDYNKDKDEQPDYSLLNR